MQIERKNYLYKHKADIHLIVLLIAALAYLAYWIYFGYYRYENFQSHYFDLGLDAQSFYIHAHYTSVVSGLQYFSFMNHLSPLGILIVPYFELFQNPVSLIILQDLAFAAASIFVYFIGKNVLKSKYLGLILGIAFLINPGIRGLTVYEFHLEAFIPVFFITSFYLYMQKRRTYFVISYVLLLSVMETAVPVGATLIVALFVYGLIYDRGQLRADSGLFGVAAILTLFYLLFYLLTANYLIHEYAIGMYQSLPHTELVIPFLSASTNPNLVSLNLNSGAFLYLFIEGALLASVVLFLGFGLAEFVDPIITAILLSPWLINVLILRDPLFLLLNFQYFGYSVGGSLVVVVLGLKILKEKKPYLVLLRRFRLDSRSIAFAGSMTMSISLIVSTITFLALQGAYPKGYFTFSGALNLNVSGINKALSTIPPNSTVLAQSPLATHLYYILNLEVLTSQPIWYTWYGHNATLVTYWKLPDYIVIDRQLREFYANQTENLTSKGYTLYENASGVEVYKSNKIR